ncbi:MAG TPA: ferritin-like domain-containing protein [Pusillimonas sp.]|uniref:ferritin-like domain-containing protein n=1 Tax=Pusillimonas sp. TaxID=3040095 RepID=UPI002CB62DF5|nr:ferritin-like domain-containing protein [Pusillimonas sp.]HUH88569.1 ferritin-like domain-containing protein [Pusillimonas sp.]
MRPSALAALLQALPADKVAAVRALHGRLAIDSAWCATQPPGIPGRPERPHLVEPSKVKSRSPNTMAGRAALIHSLAHIEFNAINLALDIIWRFDGMPEQFYQDWAGVARDEADHFILLVAHLRSMGHEYGDFPAHDGLWEMAERTSQDLLARLALVPRTLEARGLDASPPIRSKLAAAGDMRGAGILDIILRDEIGHVAIGNKWYGHVCRQRSLDPIAQYRELARRYRAPRLRGPFNMQARRAAGFSEAELEALHE